MSLTEHLLHTLVHGDAVMRKQTLLSGVVEVQRSSKSLSAIKFDVNQKVNFNVGVILRINMLVVIQL